MAGARGGAHGCLLAQSASAPSTCLHAINLHGLGPKSLPRRPACFFITRLAPLPLFPLPRLLTPSHPFPPPCLQLRDEPAARDTWLQLVAHEPSNGHACHALGSLEQQQGRLEAAEKWYRQGCDSAGVWRGRQLGLGLAGRLRSWGAV